MYLPSGVYSGPSSSPLTLVRLTSGPLPVAGLHVEDFEDGAEEVAIGHQRVLRGAHNPHVTEQRALGHLGIVGAQHEADENFVAEVDVGDLHNGERIAVAGRREDVGAPF